MMGLGPSAIVFLVLTAGCGMLSSYFTLREIEEVNRKLREEEQIEYAFMYPGKMRKVKLAYKRFYPRGATNRWRLVSQTAAFIFLGLTALVAGFLH
jgi:hypothetical protein